MQKKKIKKYQFGNNPCGEGTVWDEVKKQCVPVIEKNITQQDLLWGNLISSNGTPTINETLYPVYTSGGVLPSALKSAGTDATGKVIKSDVVYPKGVGVKDGRGRFIPQNIVIGEALDQGFNLDSDNVYRKKEITEDKNKLWYSPTFQALNAAMDITRLIANPINDAKNSKEEREKLLKARYMRSKYNLDENGLNNVPVYMQTGGYVNNTGYTPGTDTFNNPFNIIPSGNITMKNTPFPIMAYPNVGSPKMLYPGGKYNFPKATSVLEIPSMQIGGDAYSGYSEQPAPQEQSIAKIPDQAPVHEDGGVNVNNVAELEQGEVYTEDASGNPVRVLEDTSDKRADNKSKSLKITPEEAEQLINFKPKRSITHSRLFEEASKYYDKKFKSLEKKVGKNLEYVRLKNGGSYAQNAFEENLKMLQQLPTAQQIFDAIYSHQQEAKRKYNIENKDEMKYGGTSNWQNGLLFPHQENNGGLTIEDIENLVKDNQVAFLDEYVQDDTVLLSKLIENGDIQYLDENDNPRAKAEGRSSKFTKGGKWEVVKDLKGYPTHEQGGVDIKLGKDGFSFTGKDGEIKAANGLVLPKIK